MPGNELGKVRRSAAIMNYGPGAIVDFRAGGGPVSVVAAGLEQWDERAPPAGLTNPQTVFEPRLQKKLRVDGFRLPPVYADDGNDAQRRDAEERVELVGVRFPGWLQCPSCDVLRAARDWASEPGNPARYCPRCTAARPGGDKVHVIPVRFVVACGHGHLDDFPWHYWVRHASGCTRPRELTLRATRAGLAGLVLSCAECGASNSLEKIFQRGALGGVRCGGRRPWLAGPNEACGRELTVLQRGASNLYFPQVMSALDIPPWSDDVQKMLGMYWQPLCNAESSVDRERFLSMMWPQLGLAGRIELADLVDLVERRVEVLAQPERENLRWDEYQQIRKSEGRAVKDREFEVRAEEVPERLAQHVSRIVRLVRLREVRALTSFTRIEPPGQRQDGDAALEIEPAPLSRKRHNWLPATEVRGEGIFIELDPQRLRAWSNREPVVRHAIPLVPALKGSVGLWNPEHQDVEPALVARFLLVHTLAHVLMKQLSLECGYASAALRERLFVAGDPGEMSGLLIYTATADADGTLGGLQRQGRTERFVPMMIEALRNARWCSSDPLCIEGLSSASESTSLAACHACVLAPETSCEEFNRFLDRTVLVGRPGEPGIGFFEDGLEDG